MGFKMYERIENDKYLDVKQEQCMQNQILQMDSRCVAPG